MPQAKALSTKEKGELQKILASLVLHGLEQTAVSFPFPQDSKIKETFANMKVFSTYGKQKLALYLKRKLGTSKSPKKCGCNKCTRHHHPPRGW